ncbi:MAG: LCP family protein [Candidatus Levybacteria bacterium]|nr:LCP family protein [Candidatus Levybacteria bacterium]
MTKSIQNPKQKIIKSLPVKKTKSRKILLLVIILILVILGKYMVGAVKISPVIFQLLFNKNISLKKADHNINLLLLGTGGGTHEGPNLTDTIIFTSIDQTKNKTTLVSIPRDFWVPDISAKINTAYATGEFKRKGGGLLLTKAVVSKIINQPIDYAIRIDFDGFVRAVDLAGGIDVKVGEALDDYEYPIEGKENDVCGHTPEEVEFLATSSAQLEAFPCRYMYIHYDKGLQHMDGDKALKFVRSRHAKGDEGTDFARSARQAKVIAAFKNKLLSLQTLLNPVKIVSLYETMSQNIDTDIQQSEFDDFVRLFQKMRGAKMQNAVLDYGDEKTNRPGLLTNPLDVSEYDNQWVLIPRLGNGDFSEIQKYIDCEIKIGNCLIAPTLTIIKFYN